MSADGARCRDVMTDLKDRVFAGKYRLVRQLAEGGMGTVYEAVHMLLNKTVALKTMLPELAANQTAVERFFQEAKAASAIGHPNIVEVFDMGQEEDGTVFFVMELLKGKSLETMIEEHTRLDPVQVVSIILQILSALHFAHEKGIIHRDLKPANVFLAVDIRGREEVKLLDFGVAKVERSDSDQKQLTMPGTLIGTPQYFAPEQITGIGEIDHRIDLWAVGVLMYELISGKTPFAGDGYIEVFHKVLMSDPVPLEQLVKEIHPDITRVVMKALAKKREERFQSAKEMIQALTSFQNSALNMMSTMVAGILKSSFPPPLTGAEPKNRPLAAEAKTPNAPGAVEIVATDQAKDNKSETIPLELEDSDIIPEHPDREHAGLPGLNWIKSRGARIILLAAILLVIGSSLILALTFQKPEHVKEAPPQTKAEIVPKVAGKTAQSNPVAAKKKEERPIHISLKGLPPRAWVSLDYKKVEMPIVVPLATSPAILRISAPGYRTYEQAVSLLNDQELTIKMQKNPPAKKKRRK